MKAFLIPFKAFKILKKDAIKVKTFKDPLNPSDSTHQSCSSNQARPASSFFLNKLFRFEAHYN